MQLNEAPRKHLDAIEILMQDHRELESLFREFEYLDAKDEDTGRVVDAACAELRTHHTLNAELFLPAVSEAIDETEKDDMLAQAEKAHQAIPELIARVERSDADRAQRDANFRLLTQHVERQFELSETRVFPRARQLPRLDLLSVADRMKARKNDLVHQV